MSRNRFKNLLFNLLVLVALVSSVGFPGCIFDPWPEPGGESDMASGDSDSDTDTDYDTGGDSDWEAGDSELVFCSAPSPDGNVTVVGAIGAIPMGDSIIVEGSDGQQAVFPLYEDGSFAGRIQAQAGEDLYLTVEGGGEESEPIVIAAGILEGDPIGETIVDSGAVPSPDGEGVVYIHGGGPWLEPDVIIVSGNIDLSTGNDGVSECVWGDCQFDLYISAHVGNQLDLFLVRDGENSGHSDSQTVVVPAP